MRRTQTRVHRGPKARNNPNLPQYICELWLMSLHPFFFWNKLKFTKAQAWKWLGSLSIFLFFSWKQKWKVSQKYVFERKDENNIRGIFLLRWVPYAWILESLGFLRVDTRDTFEMGSILLCTWGPWRVWLIRGVFYFILD